MTAQTCYLDLSKMGVMLYPYFVHGYGFSEQKPAMVLLLLELDTDKQVIKKDFKLNNHLCLLYQTDNKQDDCPTQRLFVVKPLIYQKATDGFGVDEYAHITTVQLLELLGEFLFLQDNQEENKKENFNYPVLTHKDLTTRFFQTLNVDMQRFFDVYIKHSTKNIGVASKDGICTFDSVFGRFILQQDGVLKHESEISDDKMSLLYYHPQIENFNDLNDDLYHCLFDIIQRTIKMTCKAQSPNFLIRQMLLALQTKPKTLKLKNLVNYKQKDKSVYDLSDYIINHFEQLKVSEKLKQQNIEQEKFSVGFYHKIIQLLYLSLCQQFFAENKYSLDYQAKHINIMQVLQMFKKTQGKISSVFYAIRNEEIKRLLVNSQKSYVNNLPDIIQEQQITTSIGLNVLMLGLLQSTTNFKDIIGVEGNPLLVLSCCKIQEKGDIYFKISNRFNGNASGLLEMFSVNNLKINIRQYIENVSFSDVIDDESKIKEAIFISHLDKNIAKEAKNLPFYLKQETNKEISDLYIKDLSLFATSQAIVSRNKQGDLITVAAGVFITPYRHLESQDNTDLKSFLYWLSFYYQHVRVLRLSGNLVGVNHDVHMVAFFSPYAQCQDSNIAKERLYKIHGFGNIAYAKTIDEISRWVVLESIYINTKSIFGQMQQEESVLSINQIEQQDKQEVAKQQQEQALLDNSEIKQTGELDDQDDDIDDLPDEDEDGGDDNFCKKLSEEVSDVNLNFLQGE